MIEYVNKYGDDAYQIYKNRKDGGLNENNDEKLKKLNDIKYEWYFNLKNKPVQIQDSYGIDWNAIPSFGGGASSSSGGIDWGITIESTGSAEQKKEKDGGGIVWDIQVESESTKQQQISSGNNNIDIKLQSKGSYKEVDFVETILSKRETRNLLINELNEIIYFYRHRISEAKNYSGNALFQVYDSDSSAELFDKTPKALEENLGYVQELLSLITNAQFRQLLII